MASILYLTPAGKNDGVGGSGRVKNMLALMEQLGYNVNIISYIPKKSFGIKHETERKVRTTTIYVPKNFPLLLKAFSIFPIIWYGFKYVLGSDIIFSHAPSIITGFPALFLSKIFNKPLIVDHIDIKDPQTPKFIFDIILKNSNVFVISHYLEQEVKNQLSVESDFIPIFLDTDIFRKNNSKRKEIRKNLGIKDDDIVIGYSGSFWYIEGVSFLIKAFKNIVKDRDNVKLVLIGAKNVPNSENIEQIIMDLSLDNNVILLPPQLHEKMPDYLSVFDIACSPKIDCEENRAANPIKIYEYMSMGLITVSSSIGEVVNVINDGYNGYFVKPEDLEELETKLIYLVDNFDKIDGVGLNARNEIIKKYSIKVYLKKVDNILNRVIN